jgi:hypothetical protein
MGCGQIPRIESKSADWLSAHPRFSVQSVVSRPSLNQFGPPTDQTFLGLLSIPQVTVQGVCQIHHPSPDDRGAGRPRVTLLYPVFETCQEGGCPEVAFASVKVLIPQTAWTNADGRGRWGPRPSMKSVVSAHRGTLTPAPAPAPNPGKWAAVTDPANRPVRPG